MRFSRVVSLLVVLSIFCTAKAQEKPAAKKANVKPEKKCPCAEKAKKGAKATAARGSYGGPPCYCLQQKWLDYPGQYDLYVCRTHVEDCDESEEEMWYGARTYPQRPQDCDLEQCEPEDDIGRAATGERKGIDGHGMVLTAKTAWESVHVALESAQKQTPVLKWEDPEYHTIPREVIPEGVAQGDILVMAVAITGKRPNGNKHYLCIQIDSMGDNSRVTQKNATFQAYKPGSGHQGTIKYTVEGDAEPRNGWVWLK